MAQQTMSVVSCHVLPNAAKPRSLRARIGDSEKNSGTSTRSRAEHDFLSPRDRLVLDGGVLTAPLAPLDRVEYRDH